MPYNNNRQNRGPSINTTLTTIFAPEAMLTLKAWNRNLSLEFARATGDTDENGLSSYEKDSSHHILTSLTYEKCLALKDAYDKVLRPAIVEGQPKSISVMIRTVDGEQKLLTLGFNGSNPFIRIACALSSDGTATSDNTVVMNLRPVEVLTDYNTLDGTSEAASQTFIDLDKFIDCISNVGVAGFLTGHAIRYGNALYSSYANNRNSGNNAAYGRGGYGNNQYGNNGYQNNSYQNNYQQGNQYNANNAFMPSDLTMDGDINDTLPFN